MQMEPQEAVDKLRQTVRVLSAFKSYYFDNKARTLEETPNNPWKFQNSALFGRLDTFLDRCNDVLNLSQTALQFHKLERVEVGGTKVCGCIVTSERLRTQQYRCVHFLSTPPPSMSLAWPLMYLHCKKRTVALCQTVEVLEGCAGQDIDQQREADLHRLSDSCREVPKAELRCHECRCHPICR